MDFKNLDKFDQLKLYMDYLIDRLSVKHGCLFVNIDENYVPFYNAKMQNFLGTPEIKDLTHRLKAVRYNNESTHIMSFERFVEYKSQR